MEEIPLWCWWLVKGKMNHTGYHSILQHHVIPSGTHLEGQGFISIQDNDPNHTSKLCQRYIKSKEEEHVLQLISWSAQSLNWWGINLTEKSDLNIPQVLLTCSHFCWKDGQNYLQFASSLWWKECRESVKQWDRSNESFWWNKSLRIFLCFFLLFNLYLMWLKKTCI